MKLITPILSIFFPAMIRQDQQVLLLHQELQQANLRYQEEAGTKKSLLTEIEYLYSILIHMSGHRYLLHILPNLPPMLQTTGNHKEKMVFVLYVPSECKEIAVVTARKMDGTLVIETIVLSEMVMMSKQLSKLVVQQLISEARRQQVAQITNGAGKAVLPQFKETARLSELLGLLT